VLCEGTEQTLLPSGDVLQCVRCGLISSPQRDRPAPTAPGEGIAFEALDRVGRIASGYAVGGTRLVEMKPGAGRFRSAAERHGWEPTGSDGMEIGAGEADAVVMLDVLEHLNDPVAALRRVREGLDDRALLVAGVVDASRARTPADARRALGFAHRHVLTKQTAHAMLQLAGFRMVEWMRLPGAVHGPLGGHPGGSDSLASAGTPNGPVSGPAAIALIVARPA
ncbi:MAG: methyltransferase domain-containing protein, partial [Actinomycetota bacterium]